MNTHSEAIHEHFDALMVHGRDAVAKTSLFPFVHIQPNGEKLIFQSADDLPDLSDLPFKSKILDFKLLESCESSAIYSVLCQRYDLEGNETVRVNSIFGLSKIENSWRVGWRHFLGEISSAS